MNNRNSQPVDIKLEIDVAEEHCLNKDIKIELESSSNISDIICTDENDSNAIRENIKTEPIDIDYYDLTVKDIKTEGGEYLLDINVKRELEEEFLISFKDEPENIDDISEESFDSTISLEKSRGTDPLQAKRTKRIRGKDPLHQKATEIW